MKKTYINPELEVIKIATQQMLASSETLGLDSTPANEIDDPGQFLSREDDFLDE